MLKKIALVALFTSSVLSGARAFAAEAAAEETKPLSSSIALGVNVNDGNTDNSMYNASFTLTKISEAGNTLRLAADGAYGKTEDDKTTDNANASLDYRHLFASRCYGAFNTSYKTDDIADLDYRVVVSPGGGYYLIKRDNVNMTAEAGPALISEKKGGESTDQFALRFAERYERTMDTSAKFWQSAEYLPLADDFDTYLLNAEIGVEAPISGNLNVRLVVRNAYDSNPAPDRENNDLSVLGALAYSLF
jgi:putative salt-induced outer membrane protein YdiY